MHKDAVLFMATCVIGIIIMAPIGSFSIVDFCAQIFLDYRRNMKTLEIFLHIYFILSKASIRFAFAFFFAAFICSHLSEHINIKHVNYKVKMKN